MSLPVGWFPDPSDPEREMLWDGDQWTGLTRPRRTDSAAAQSDGDVGAEDALEPSRGRRKPRPRRRPLVLALVILAVVVIVGGGGTAVAVVHARQVAAAAEKAEQKKEAAARTRAEQREAQRAAQEEADEAERSSRAETVKEVEASVKTMAEENVTKGLLDGPILSVSCNPVSGSTDDLTDTTTSFDCFAANTDNADGTQSGYFFNSTVNWDSGEYTYGLGKSAS
ncbi:hypothetical protein GCM10009769_32550 [Curtobacterium luteum]|uniref:DUF2510 domain-containing protein n=1 Tax=Curtobacterium luteum TaxID=33881 RepID=A0A8H9GCE7_9MICO|nr:DUF2510 domain-containing protein [Curtobacterium luteum]GGL12055.1 hypothetical protein GCM10009769_32550 [Curtobacterium luteum]